MKTSQRLTVLFEAVGQLIERYRQKQRRWKNFFQQKCQNGTFHRARQGVAILATALKGIDVYEYTPLQVKQAVAGYGRA